MSKSDNLGDFLDDLAEGIKAKKGISYAINPQSFRSEIESIETGGSSSATDVFSALPTSFTIVRNANDHDQLARLNFITDPDIVLPATATRENTYFFLELASLSIQSSVRAIVLPTSSNSLAGIKLRDIEFRIDDSSGNVTYGMGLSKGQSMVVNCVATNTYSSWYTVSIYCDGRIISITNERNSDPTHNDVNTFIP